MDYACTGVFVLFICYNFQITTLYALTALLREVWEARLSRCIIHVQTDQVASGVPTTMSMWCHSVVHIQCTVIPGVFPPSLWSRGCDTSWLGGGSGRVGGMGMDTFGMWGRCSGGSMLGGSGRPAEKDTISVLYSIPAQLHTCTYIYMTVHVYTCMVTPSVQTQASKIPAKCFNHWTVIISGSVLKSFTIQEPHTKHTLSIRLHILGIQS